MIRGPKIELYSNEHVDKVSLVVKSSITFYLIKYHKNAFHNELFLSFFPSVCLNLQMELYLLDLVKNHSQTSALGCLESVANKKGGYLEKKGNL